MRSESVFQGLSMNDDFVRRRDQSVTEVLDHLRRLVRESEKTQRNIEEENGFARGYLSQVLNGHMSLTVRHLFGILQALEIPPGEFFTRLTGDSELQDSWLDMDEIRQRMARYDSVIKELEDQGLVSPEPEE